MTTQPLAGLRVIEFSQMVMGPCCGLILADLGAEVIKIEPLPRGDRTRYLPGLAAGFFAAFNRNKKSIAVDMKGERGLSLVKRLVASSDIVIENFKPGMMAGFGLDYASLAKLNERLIFCSLKGFLPGPYEHRTALDEMVQMMGGLVFMTGLPGRPMRAGASVNDIMGAMFGVIAIQGAIREREHTGRGQEVQAALFENNVFLMAQAMMCEVVSGQPSIPYSIKDSPWPVYDLFDTRDGSKLFVTIVGEEQWEAFCRAFDRESWLADPRFATSNDRVDHRGWLIPEIAKIFKQWDKADLAARLEQLDLPYAPVNKPGDLFDDPHLNQSGGLTNIHLPDGGEAKTPLLPISMDGRRLPNRYDPPQIGEQTREILSEIGISSSEIETLQKAGTIRIAPGPS